MRTQSRWLTLVVASLALGGTAAAQPDVRDHRTKQRPPDVRERRVPPPPADAGPREAPPSPREERQAARAGYVWIPGHWDWKASKWDWTAGHWERERAGKTWQAGRWERRGDVWAYVEGQWVAGTATPPPAPDRPDPRPRQAPPTPREERQAARAGYVWAAGRWDWKDGKWDWQAGHWERERAGKTWRPGRWEPRDGAYILIEGEWIDVGATPQPGPPTSGPIVPPDHPSQRPPRPHHEWKLERPVVSSYWPMRGKAGTKVVIRGRNFPTDSMVVWAGAPIRAARVLADQVVFEVPAGSTSGLIALRTGRGRDLGVGTFEVVASYDAVAEAKRLEDERRRAAEAAWVERQRALAKDRAAREAAWRQRDQERETTREQRRAERAAELRARWDRAFLADPETQDELTLHAQRVAELGRMLEVAELSSNGKLAVRVSVARAREDERHNGRMAGLKAAFAVKGGTP